MPEDVEGVGVRGGGGGLQAAQQGPPPLHPLLPPVAVHGEEDRLAQSPGARQHVQRLVLPHVADLGHDAGADAIRDARAC